ncbi:WXG100 family type VII secretion target [Actinomadura opuntiae]|uniref:WXG100 family type VII secretion target n=1 Tax=Actinomadura sp. OS1-43 TaxID=604315 RepID=UPI00255AB1F8|nr:hypothetical protein [Actinomadura sp. OS1-43]MDL4820765.1 hypothetical protein [Actinomadura sp. OS1-43]
MTDVKNSPLREPAPAGNPDSYATKEMITAYLRGVDPGTVTASGQAYLDLAAGYDKAMTELRTFAHDLASAWKGPASNAAQGQLRELFTAAFQISSRSQQVGTAVKNHGTSYLAWYKTNMPAPKTLEEARQWMQGANERATETWSAIPADISTGLPPIKFNPGAEYGTPAGGSGSASGSGHPAGSGGATNPLGSDDGGTVASRAGTTGRELSPTASGAHGPQGGPTHPAGDGSGSVIGRPVGGAPSDGALPPAGDSGGTQLSGFPPSGTVGAGFGNGGSGSYGLGGGGFDGLGLGGSAGSGLPGGGAGGGLPGGSAVPPGAGGGFLPGPGAIGGVQGQGAPSSARSPATGRPGTPGAGVPGAPGRGGRSDEERERRAWLPDDHDLWEEGIEAVPGVIGDAPPKPIQPEKPASDEQTDEAALLRRVLARLTELESRGHTPPPAPPRMEWTD